MPPGLIQAPLEAGRVRLLRGSLDRRLAAGANPDGCRELRRRADQLCSSRHRRELGGALLALVEQAARPARPFSAAVPIDRRAVLDARGELVALALDLGATDLAPSPRGIALVERLLRDGASPVYTAMGQGALERVVRHAHAALLCD